MTLSLRSQLVLAFAVVAAVPLVVIEQATARRVRGEFEARVESMFEGSIPSVQQTFARASERVGAGVKRASEGYALRDALLSFAVDRGARRQRLLIDAVAAAAAEASLPILALYHDDGTVLASAQEPERFDVHDTAAVALFRAHPSRPFLAREEGVAMRGLALRVALPLEASGERYWLAGGEWVGGATLPAPPESTALLLVGPSGIEAAPSRAGREAVRVLAGRGAGEVGAVLTADRWDVREVALPGVAVAEPTRFLLAASRRPLEQSLAELQWWLAMLLVAGLGLAAVLAVLITRRWTAPIDVLVDGLDRVARGDLGWRIEIERRDEIGRLIGAFHAMTRDLAESHERLRLAERVAAWREIARRLAHEIKNPLSPIALSMETLRRAHAAGRPDFPDLLEECTATVREEVERLRRIVQEFSDFARLPKPRRIEESFHEVVRGVASLYAGLGDRHRILLDLEEGPGRLVFDPDQMNRLLVNLVKNAIEAMPEGGEVRVSSRSERARGVFTLTVADAGAGIAGDVAARLFEPYTTTKEGGSGLGLAISHRIASEHGGTLRLLNPGERGARFRLELPLAAPPDEPALPGTTGA